MAHTCPAGVAAGTWTGEDHAAEASGREQDRRVEGTLASSLVASEMLVPAVGFGVQSAGFVRRQIAFWDLALSQLRA